MATFILLPPTRHETSFRANLPRPIKHRNSQPFVYQPRQWELTFTTKRNNVRKLGGLFFEQFSFPSAQIGRGFHRPAVR